MTTLNAAFLDDGTLRIDACGGVLRQGFPGLDGRPLRPLSVETGPDWARYRAPGLDLQLSLVREGDSIRLRTEILSMNDPAADLHPFFEAEAVGLRGAFTQNLGLRGDYGYQDRPMLDGRAAGTDSTGLLALHLPAGHLVLAVHEHDRFLARFRILPVPVGAAPHRLTFGFALERTRAGAFRLPDLHLSAGPALDGLLDAQARRIAAAMGARPPARPSYNWCSWYYRFNYMDLDTLDEYLAAFSALRDQVPLRTIQLDAGYCRTPGDWLEPNAQWPGGLREAFRRIGSAGYVPGIWIAPFVVGNLSRLAKEHPDWILRRADGAPHVEKRFYEWRKPWPNPDTEYFVLDISHPEAMAHILSIFRTLRAWGARMIKTDFMLWHFQDPGTVLRHDPSRTTVEWFRILLAGIRDAVGEETFWLGCIAPFLPFLGYADAMRIGGDVFSAWSTVHMRNLAAKLAGSTYFNHIYWENDPDVLVLRDFDTELAPGEVAAVSLLQALYGGMVATSDPLHRLAPDRLALFRFVRPFRCRKPHVPCLDQRRDDLVLTLCDPALDRYLVFLFNPTDQPLVRQVDLRGLFADDPDPGPLFLSEWMTRSIGETPVRSLVAEIPAHGARLYYGSRSSAVRSFPDNLRWETDEPAGS